MPRGIDDHGNAGLVVPRPTTAIRRTVQAGTAFLEGEAPSGILLMAAAAAAVIWANVGPDSYNALFQTRLSVGVAPLALSKPLVLWINDGLMAIFFFLVGLEIKREIVRGQLASVRQALLPVVAAAGGMVAPAAIYALLNVGGPGARGWGIPMATDIAFALGALALLGKRVAPSLRVFLTAVAIADDLGAVAVIAIFYTSDLSWPALAVAAMLLAMLFITARNSIHHPLPYVVLGVAVWIAVLKSGVHATVAGVLLAFTIPASRGPRPTAGRHGQQQPLLDRLEHGLEPWVAFGIMPIFALANAGVRVSSELAASLVDPIALGVMLGLFVGKQVGIVASCWALIRSGLGSMPSQATWRQLYGVALLCGIGFTMSLFIATLAFEHGDTLTPAKIGVLTGSLISGIVGYSVLARARRPVVE
jgi:Na+:H+ antiporter, NhaA family